MPFNRALLIGWVLAVLGIGTYRATHPASPISNTNEFLLHVDNSLYVESASGDVFPFSDVAADGIVVFASHSCLASLEDVPAMWERLRRIDGVERYIFLTGGAAGADAFLQRTGADPGQVIWVADRSRRETGDPPSFVIEAIPTVVWYREDAPTFIRIGRAGPTWPVSWVVRDWLSM